MGNFNTNFNNLCFFQSKNNHCKKKKILFLNFIPLFQKTKDGLPPKTAFPVLLKEMILVKENMVF